MFTGLVEEKGNIISVDDSQDGKQLTIGCTRVLEDVAVDQSISVNGVCLTVVAFAHDHFKADVIAETLGKTTVGTFATGTEVNLERAVRMSDRLGGHLVQGHVDATGIVDEILQGNKNNSPFWEMWISFDVKFRKWLIPVGSVCVDGVSLTVADLESSRFKVALIPHTLVSTTLGALTVGASVNLEFDVLAKYADNLLTQRNS